MASAAEEAVVIAVVVEASRLAAGAAGLATAVVEVAAEEAVGAAELVVLPVVDVVPHEAARGVEGEVPVAERTSTPRIYP